MIAESQNTALLTVGKAATENKAWIKFAQYCFDREKGLRKQALGHLNEFLKSAESWTEEEKIKFVTFLLPFFEVDSYALFPQHLNVPQPLSEKLIKPTLEKWCLKEMTDSKPFRWYGRYYHNNGYINRALEINSHDDKARQVLLSWGINGLWYSVHHLPEGYIGNEKEDLVFIDELQNHISKLSDVELQRNWTNIVEQYAELVRNYAEWKESGHLDLEKWGEENHKRVSSGVGTYYYEK